MTVSRCLPAHNEQAPATIPDFILVLIKSRALRQDYQVAPSGRSRYTRITADARTRLANADAQRAPKGFLPSFASHGAGITKKENAFDLPTIHQKHK
ncbi:hypothetical protein EVAR_95078_1 [Eumeta japonica]|uniref:Uncharacterized protein n=1 Tax=Eumeta variegata TaxID=151549 RepID=A0A4C1W530_EUMVA|nr:hypothetical protein EVAR_95078_1 [Eumeta japonica]